MTMSQSANYLASLSKSLAPNATRAPGFPANATRAPGFPDALVIHAGALRGALLLGSAGALFAMRVFHHKTRHWYFRFGIPAILLAQIALGVFVYVRFFAA